MSRLLGGLILGYLIYWGIRKLAQSLGLWPQAPRPVDQGRGTGRAGPGPGLPDLHPPQRGFEGGKGRKSLFFLFRRLFKAFPT